ncbi:MAG: FAD-dependent monooxygenase [Gammaproteobacteria bacterium]
MQQSIAIAGGGIAGLTAALALQQRGRAVCIYEQASQLSEIGAGLTLSPNATRVLIGLGLEHALASRARVPGEQVIQHFRTGEALLKVSRGTEFARKYGAPYWQIHRADLHNTLLDAVLARDPDCLKLEHRLKGLRQDEAGVRLEFQNGATAEVPVLLGCDGLKSAVRGWLFDEGEPEFTGYAVWRGMVPRTALSAKALTIPAGLFIGPDRMLARYSLRDGALINYAASQRRDTWTEEGWTINAPVAELLDLFADFHPTAREIMAATPADSCFRWGLFSRQPLQEWSRGRVALLGDAAHPTLPFLGQGANLAIEDGLVAARALVSYSDSAEALRNYSATRVKRGTRVMQQSVTAVERYFNSTSTEFDPSRLVNEESLGLFDYDASTVPIEG